MRQLWRACHAGVVFLLTSIEVSSVLEAHAVEDGHHGESAPSGRGHQCGASSLSVLMVITLMNSHNNTAITDIYQFFPTDYQALCRLSRTISVFNPVLGFRCSLTTSGWQPAHLAQD